MGFRRVMGVRRLMSSSLSVPWGPRARPAAQESISQRHRAGNAPANERCLFN